MDEFNENKEATENLNNISKSDIIDLLKVGLQQNQPFARSFADTILRELDRKFKNLNIQSSAIFIDGKEIGQEVTKNIKENVKAKTEGIADDIEKNIKKNAGKIKFGEVIKEEKPKSLSDIIGSTEEFSFKNKLRYNKIVRNVLDTLEQKTKKTEFQIDEKISLNSLFAGKNDSLISPVSWGWHKARVGLLNKLTNNIKDVKFNFTKLSLNDLFYTKPANDYISAFQQVKWFGLKKNLITKITDNLQKDIKIKKITLDDVFGIENRNSLLSAFKWNSLQKALLEKIQAAINAFDVRINPISIDFNTKQKKTTERKNETSKQDYVKPTREEKKGPVFKSLEEKENITKIDGFTANAKKELKDLLNIKRPSQIIKTVTEKKKDDKGWMSSLLKTIGVGGSLGLLGLSMLGGGIAATVSSLFQDGPFKGLTKAAGNIATNMGASLTKKFLPDLAKTFTKLGNSIVKSLSSSVSLLGRGAQATVLKSGKGISSALLKSGSKFLTPLLKRIPVIGTVLSLASAATRIKDGDFIGGLLDISSGIATLVPGLGTAISIAIDLFSAGRDLKTGGSKVAGKSDLNKKIGKQLEKAPFIGTLIRISKGIGALSAGDWKGAGIYLASSIPGINWLFDADEVTKAAESGKSLNQVINDWCFKKGIKFIKAMPQWAQRIFTWFDPELAKYLKLPEEEINKMIDSKPVKAFDLTQKHKEAGNTEEDISYLNEAKTPAERSKRALEIGQRKKSQEISAPANDFIMKADGKVQHFNKQDNIIATKDEKLFNKLIDVVQKKEFTSEFNTEPFKQLHYDIINLIGKIEKIAMSKNETTAPVSISSSGSYDSDRDPAYNLRLRIWDRINHGGVVL